MIRIWKIFVCILSFTIANLTIAQEICNNGIDDDGDGMIDLNDVDDCTCDSVISYLPNPSFEEHSGVPHTYGQLYYCDHWEEASKATSDYFCDYGYMSGREYGQPPTPFPDGHFCAGGFNGAENMLFYKEYTGTRLTPETVLEKDSTYTLCFYLGISNEEFITSLFGGEVISHILNNTSTGTYQLFGAPDSTHFPFFGKECPTVPYRGNDTAWSVLADFEVYETETGWYQKCATFTPEEEIQAIVIGPDDSLHAPIGGDQYGEERKTIKGIKHEFIWTHYYFIDNITLEKEFPYGEVYMNGHPCSDTFQLKVDNPVEHYNYQWYINGIAVVGETDTSYHGSFNQNDEIQVRAILKDRCHNSKKVKIPEIEELELSTSDSIVDICLGDSITIEATGSGGHDTIVYEWSDGSKEQSIEITPTENTSLTIQVKDGCDSVESLNIPINVIQPLDLDYDIFPKESCSPLNLSLMNSTLNSESCEWKIETNTFNNCNENVELVKAGKYEVSLLVRDKYGCETLSEIDSVEVWPNPVANFINDPEYAISNNNKIQFTDESSNDVISWFWWFSLNENSEVQNPTHTFSEPGDYPIYLKVTNEFGCEDTIFKTITYKMDFVIFGPNVFSPNDDGMNDVFQIKGSGIDKENFEMLIFNRWGELIFETHTYEIGWNGRVLGKEEIAPIGVYSYKVSTKSEEGKTISKVGRVSIIK